MLKWLRRARRRVPVDLPEPAADHAAEQLLAMDAAIEDLADLRALDAVRVQGELPAGFGEHWTRALLAYDAYVVVCLSEGSNGQPVSTACRLSCTGCCQRPPKGVHAVELLHILHQSPDRAGAAHFAPSGPCAFLDEAGACTIYPLRPLACRRHFSRSDPELCWPGHPRSKRAPTFDLSVPHAIDADLKAISARMGLAALDSDLGRGLVQLRDDILGGRPLKESPTLRRNPRRARDS